MVRPRIELQNIFRNLLGSNNVYFQPPPNVQLKYPCIIYEINDIPTWKANNKPYIKAIEYTVSIIDYNADSQIHFKVGDLPYASYDRTYTVDNLNHNIYSLYF